MRVAAITGGRNVPSARFRVRQFVEPLRRMGVALDELPHGYGDTYPPSSRFKRPGWAALRLASLLPVVLKSRSFDAVMLQREMLSSLATLERFTGRPRIFDVDDSIHLLRGGGFVRAIAGHCDRVIAGNAYLAEFYSALCPDVRILPTAVDTDRYLPAARKPGEEIMLGWIGTSANFAYLEQIEPALHRVMEAEPAVRLQIMADRPPSLAMLDPARWRFEPWSEAREVSMIQALDIGLMPLPDTPWTQGKCSFKMLQYMACGVAVAVSPVGMNNEVLSRGAIGLGPRTLDEWTDALIELAGSQQARRDAGKVGRQVVEDHYSVQVIAPQLAAVLKG